MKQRLPFIILLSVIALRLVLRAHPAFVDRVLASFAPGSKSVAAEIAQKLRAHPAGVGPIELAGADLTLTESHVRLLVSERREATDKPEEAHFHVVADVPGEPRGLLDACVFGFGKPEAEARRNAADEFADSAFPALLSELKQASWLDAQPFSGTEVWGVPGRRGYAGPYYLRGHLQPEEIVDVPLFAGAEELPADGRLHLLKATAYVHDGGWLLTHELDGHATTVSERPWSKWPVPSEFAMIVRFAVFGKRDALGDQASRDRALSRLDGPGPWRSAPEACIAEVIPKELVDSAYSLEACKGGRLLDCLVECEGGSHNACYSAALELQPIEKLKARSEALFVRACRLGFPSACTNAAADRLGALHVKEDACSTRTFKETCERASDPWACTMYGAVLISGGSAERDLPSARQVLAKSCLHGSDDPACTAAGQLLRMITSQSGNDGG